MISPEFLNVIIIFSKILGIGNIFLLTGLLYIYWRSYKEMESKYTSGLLFFASFFLFQTIALVVALFSIKWFVTEFFIVLLEFIALSILLKISWERWVIIKINLWFMLNCNLIRNYLHTIYFKISTITLFCTTLGHKH